MTAREEKGLGARDEQGLGGVGEKGGEGARPMPQERQQIQLG
jgi:hypothetical protein